MSDKTETTFPSVHVRSAIIYPQSTDRTGISDVKLNPAWAFGNELFVFCLERRCWNMHGLALNAKLEQRDGSLVRIDESEPNTITGRKPHHPHAGEFWLLCMGYAPLDLRRILSRYPRSQKTAPSEELLAAAANSAHEVLHKLQIEKAKEKKQMPE